MHIGEHIPPTALEILKKQKGKSPSNWNQAIHSKTFMRKGLLAMSSIEAQLLICARLLLGFTHKKPHVLRLLYQGDSEFCILYRKCFIFKVLGLTPNSGYSADPKKTLKHHLPCGGCSLSLLPPRGRRKNRPCSCKGEREILSSTQVCGRRHKIKRQYSL